MAFFSFHMVFDFPGALLTFSVHQHLHFALLRTDHHGLLPHPAYHIEGALRLAPKRHLQDIVRDSLLEGLSKLGMDLEIPVRRAEAPDPLVRPTVVVIFYPEPGTGPCGLEAVELGPAQEIHEDRLPESLDFSKGLGMVGTGLEVVDPVLLQLRLEFRGAPPVGVLAAVVRQHLLGGIEFADGGAVDGDHVLRGLAPEEVHPGDEAGIVVDETDQVGVPPAQAECEDVRLPHLVGRSPLEEAGLLRIPHGLLLGRFDQVFFLEGFPDRLRAGLQEEEAAQDMRDLLGAVLGILFLDLYDLILDRGGGF
jgi:hypothetical protein